MLLFENFDNIINTCKKYGITNYTINNGLVDVDGDVNLSELGLTKLPLKFGSVSGNFYCSRNNLTDLKGSPEIVGGDFSCSYNNLTTLSGSPNSVGSNFSCSYNNLTDLKGSPKSVGGVFNCRNNKLTTLSGSPNSVGGGFYCLNNNLTDLKGSPKSVGDSFYCGNNNLTNFNAFDTLFTDDSIIRPIDITNNPINNLFKKSIFNTIISYDIVRWFNSINVISDNKVNFKKLKYLSSIFPDDISTDIERIEKYYKII